MARSRSKGLRLTKVGLWFLVFVAVVALAASNTGNNGLYLVLATMIGVVFVAHLLASANLRRVDIRLDTRGEVFAGRPAHFDVVVKNGGSFLPRFALETSIETVSIEATGGGSGRLFVPHLGPHQAKDAEVEVVFPRRGRHRLRRAEVSSLFPLGFFHKRRRLPLEGEVLVYPEVFKRTSLEPPWRRSHLGERPTRKVGWGYELLGLRSFRHGDDPRGIHWKQSARTGELVFQEREIEENRRLLIVFDNAVGPLSRDGEERFEHLVSEAATAALDYLAGGFEVGLLTRDRSLPPAIGARQRRALLETLALVEAKPRTVGALLPRSGAPHLHLTLEAEEAA